MWWRKRPSDTKALEGADREGEFSPGALEVLQAPPSPVGRAISIAIMSFAAIAVAWMFLAHMDVVVTAQGRVVPAGRVKVIQPMEAGVVRAIRVRDGQNVRKGEVLIELDATATQADRERLLREVAQAQIEVARLKAQLAGSEELEDLPAGLDQAIVETERQLLASRLNERTQKLAVLDSDIARRQADRDAIQSAVRKLESAVPLMRKRLYKQQALAKKKFISELTIIESQLELINQEKELEVQRHRLQESSATLTAAKRQREQAEAEFRSQGLAELADAARRRDAAAQELVKVEQRRWLQELRAPVDGVVQQLAISTVGGVVTAAQMLMVIVPEDIGLEVEAQVLNKDIGFVEAGQRAAVKVETYPFTRHGFVEGKLQWVGRDAVTDPQNGSIYPVRIALADTRVPNVVNGQRGSVAPGMAVSADIAIGKRRVLEYFLTPLLRYKEESLRER